MLQRAMVMTLRNSLGELHNCICSGDRFQNRDLLSGMSTASDDFLEYNGWSILEGLADSILFCRPYCVVEIGAGESTKVLAKAADKAGVDFYSCDKSPRKRVMFEQAVDNVSNSEHMRFYQMFSDDFMAVFNDTPSLVLIDGDHRYEQALKEFNFFWEIVVPGGVIFLHDTYPPDEMYLANSGCGDVFKLRQELEHRTNEMDCFTWPYTAGYMGLTMVIKKEKERPYWGV